MLDGANHTEHKLQYELCGLVVLVKDMGVLIQSLSGLGGRPAGDVRADIRDRAGSCWCGETFGSRPLGLGE